MVVLLAATLCIAADAAPPRAGKTLWKITADIKLDQVNGEPPPVPKTEHEHISICEGQVPIETLVTTAALDLGDGCKAYQIRADGGKISFNVICPLDEDGFAYDFYADGTYDEQAAHLTVHGQGVVDGDQKLASGTIIAEKKGLCR